ncbi:hypothetical protein [Curtobacterium sp. MCBD17_032]|uniref:hypothetical protein n=1 Tax=Curtobacterium sp. MCBD17_032 TaxID=2175659 RepID=UPI000DA765B7|nr:hypothetical protein [Curtobacterium sp. MCBD17_032]PZE84160.1 hypothetical protein DEI91_09705 [Curtobacterium sp. MCBD17_032]
MAGTDDAEREHVTLAEYVGLARTDELGGKLCDDSEEEATALVDERIGVTAYATVPPAVRRRAILEVGADLYWRKASRNGVVGFEGADVAPIRLARDPMNTATSILSPWIVGLA